MYFSLAAVFLQDKIEFVKDDCSSYMQEAVQEGRQYDVVVLDPPKLAPNRGTLERAKTK